MADDQIFLALASLSAAKIAALILCHQKRLKKFEKVGTVKNIFQFPLKSAGSIHLQSAWCTPVGLFHDGVTDRHWMIVKKDGVFFHARTEPRLILIKPSKKGESLHLDAPGMETLILPKFPTVNKASRFIKCKIWDEYIKALLCGDIADEWIRRYTGVQGLHMVVTTPEVEKRHLVDLTKAWGNLAVEGDMMAFPDCAPYMILSEASVMELNSRIDKEFTTLRFRPNITLEGCKPFDEDKWSEVRIGDKAHFRFLELCQRCIFVNIDPYTAHKDKEEPLKTLKQFRKVTLYDDPCFGASYCIDVEGEIRVGDPVYAIWK